MYLSGSLANFNESQYRVALMILKVRKKGLSKDQRELIETMESLTVEVLRLKRQLRTTDEKLQNCKEENLQLKLSPQSKYKDPIFLSPAISPIWIFVFALALLIVGLWGGTTFSPAHSIAVSQMALPSAGGLSFLM